MTKFQDGVNEQIQSHFFNKVLKPLYSESC